ncbi:hypothetical protein Clacol_008880 [Clathrus columnatus]|uniref:Uncharacterized protein n=1 Tax=Clathrus columnatus TaxID=1419009 RepID=A0AAV5AN94_9AGAM|nr:hypothetical protein Clacol_008880 [Clathrus columnatus]
MPLGWTEHNAVIAYSEVSINRCVNSKQGVQVGINEEKYTVKQNCDAEMDLGISITSELVFKSAAVKAGSGTTRVPSLRANDLEVGDLTAL